uniref:programmed cell death 1 ligand 2-like n=1 Tax=Pristiophorus japonicus TaxID=55135 RepID=UPI00398F3371
MDSYRTISLLYVILYTSAVSAQNFVTLKCNHSVTGIFNEDTELLCTFESTTVKTISLVELSKYGEGNRTKSVFNSKENVTGAQGRIKLRCQSSQDISLVIEKTQLSDSGTYQYYLETNAGHVHQNITLKVKAPYSLPEETVFLNLTRTMDTTNLTCETIAYRPTQIHWFVDDERNLTLKAKTNNVKTTQGLFKITSTLPIKVAEIALKSNYTCAVWNEEEEKYKVQKHFQILDLPNHDQQSKRNMVLIAVFVIIGALFFVLAILVVLRFRRIRHSDRRSRPEFTMIPRWLNVNSDRTE